MSQPQFQPVGVIIPAYNSERFLPQALDSVLAQDYESLTVYVVDDGSTDQTRAIAEAYRNRDSRVRVLVNTGDHGAGSARNFGLSKADENVVAFLDSDDFWYSAKLSTQLAYMARTNSWISYTGYDVFSDAKEQLAIFRPPNTVDRKMLLKTCFIGTSTVVVDRRRTGHFAMPALKVGQDYATWLNLLRRCGPGSGLSEPLAAYRIGHASLSRNKFVKARYQWKIYRQYEHLSVVKSIFFMGHYALNGITKYRT